MFVILSWTNEKDISLVSGDDGKSRVFETHAEAEEFAEAKLNSNWEIVDL